jgi:hypothetical protein
MVVIFIALLVVFVVVLTLYLGIWNISLPPIINRGDIQAECAKWQVNNCNEGLEATENGELKYPILNQTYGTNLDKAKEFCNCPK